MIAMVAPVDPFEARQLYADCVRAGFDKPRTGTLIARQIADGATMGFALEGRLIALLVATPTDLVLHGLPTLEVSALGRADDCRPHLRQLVRLARLTLAAWLENGTVALCCVVRTGHRPGEKLAALGGFGRIRAENGLQLFTREPDEWTHSSS